VQKRLDVRLLAPSESETGWDVFILDYNVDGPIGTVKYCYNILIVIFNLHIKYLRNHNQLVRFWSHVDRHIKRFSLPCGKQREWSQFYLLFGNNKQHQQKCSEKCRKYCLSRIIFI